MYKEASILYLKHSKNTFTMDIIKLLYRSLAIVSLSLILSACQTELYTGLSEQEANEMLSLLIEHGIGVNKLPGSEQTITLSVDNNQLSRAISILNEKGYPRQKFDNMGSIFVKDGMISSPTEERARYNYALNQEISATLSLIDGVINARIHIVLPQEDSYGDNTAPASASVFIKHTPGLNTENFIPKIKSFVSTSVEELNYADVSVVLFEANKEQIALTLENAMGMSLTPDSVSTLYTIITVFSVIIVVLLGGIGFYGYFYIYRKKTTSDNVVIQTEST